MARRLPAVLLAALLAQGACGGEPPAMAPRHRFVDLGHPEVTMAALPIATIDDEQRLVLQGYPEAPVMVRVRPVVTTRAHYAVRRQLTESLRGSRRIVLSPRLKLGGEWESLPASLAPVESGPGGEFVAIGVDLPRSALGSTVTLVVDAVAPPAATAGSLETPAVEIEPGARLEFGLGVLHAARDQGPVSFTVRSCPGDAATSDPARCEEIFAESLDPSGPEGRGWHDRALDLASSGGPRSFRFDTELLPGGAGDFSLPVWSNPTVVAPVARSADEPSILLVSLDTLRADRLPSYGYPHETAPFIEQAFGREGVVVESFVAAATTTGPSHMSLFTSLHPSVHRVTGGPESLSPAAPTLAEVLRAQGFATGAVTENAALDVRRGFGRGFDTYSENKNQRVTVAEGHIDQTFAEATRWLVRHRDRRFFLFVHTYQVHHPYTPPEAYADLFGEPAEGFEVDPELPPEWQPALYDREIRFTDDQLRGLLGTLEDQGLADDTLVIVTSDHGEEFLEHGFKGHGPNVHAEVTRVPLLFRGPGLPRGHRIVTPFGHVDLMPTILDLVGAPRPETAMGRSFAPLLVQGEAAADEDRPLFGEAWYKESIRNERPTVFVRLGNRKLIRRPTASGFSHHYFDLEQDPRERTDLYPAAAREARDLEQLLDGYPGRVADVRNALAGRERELGAPRPGLALDPDREEKLRALGYLE